jgi:hypothetical protein
MTVIWTQNGIVERDPWVSEADSADATRITAVG